MASGLTAASRQLKESEDSVRCSICQDLFNDPRSLSCGHSFCLACLQKLQQSSTTKPCPNCRKETIPSTNELLSLKSNDFAAQLVELIKEHKTDVQTEQKLADLATQSGDASVTVEPDSTDVMPAPEPTSPDSSVLSSGTSLASIDSIEAEDQVLRMMGIIDSPEGAEQRQLPDGVTIQEVMSEFEEAQASMLSQIQAPEDDSPEREDIPEDIPEYIAEDIPPIAPDDSEYGSNTESTFNAPSLADSSHQTIRPSLNSARMDVSINIEPALNRSVTEGGRVQAVGESGEWKEDVEALNRLLERDQPRDETMDMVMLDVEPAPPKVIACAACSKEDFDEESFRYRCGICNDYDLCSECFQDISSLHRPSHLFVKVKATLKTGTLPLLDRLEAMRLGTSMKMDRTDHDVRCRGCRVSPIQGTRYKCGNCVDYELCEKCLLEPAEAHDPLHSFIIIPHKATYKTSFKALQVRVIYA